MKSFSGLTLIEVLIALAIVGIALTAAIKATSQNIRATTYLKDKTVAMWVGNEVMNEARVGVLKLQTGDKQKFTRDMLGREWHWEAELQETPNKRIKKIEVNVFAKENEEGVSPLITLESYVYAQE